MSENKVKSLKYIQSTLGAEDSLRYIKSVFWIASTKIASMAVSLAATFYIARNLGPQNFGELSYAVSIIGVFALFGGLVGVLYRDIISAPKQENILLGTAWIVSLCISLFTVLSVMIYVLAIPHDQITLLVIGLLCIAQFFAPFSLISHVFYAKAETKWLSLANFFIQLLISLAKIIAMMADEGVLVLAAIMLAEQIIIAITLSILYRVVHKGHILSWRFDISYAKKMIIDSSPIMIVGASGMIAGRIDQIFIKHYFDTTAVGLYSVAVQLSELWQFIPGLLLTALFPAIVNARATPRIYQLRLRFLFGAFFVYGICISALITLFATPLITFIYGATFIESIPLVQIYVWSLVGLILSFVMNHFLLTENLRRIQIYSAVIPTVLNVILNLILIPQMGTIGAAWATVISFTILPFIPFLFKNARNALS